MPAFSCQQDVSKTFGATLAASSVSCGRILNPDPFGDPLTNEEFLLRYRAAFDRLADFGVATRNADRLRRYAQTLAKLGRVDANELAKNADDVEALANAMHEASIVLDISTLPDDYLRLAQAKLKFLTSGHEREDISRPDPARDYEVANGHEEENEASRN